MIVKCLFNTEKDLIDHNRILSGQSEFTEYGELVVGKDYLVMGMILFESNLSYLIDDGIVTACPSQLFEIIDNRIPPNWHFRLTTKEEEIYPFVEGIWGYYELCFEEKSYENLIVEMDEQAMLTYFKRKMELEKYYEELELLK